MASLHLKIMTPERVVVEETVDTVNATSVDGEFGVMPHHIPLVTPLKVGLLHYSKGGQRVDAAIMGGVFHTDGENVTILTDAAELSDQVDSIRAEDARKRAESRLREKSDGVDVQRAQLSLARATIRLKLAGKA